MKTYEMIRVFTLSSQRNILKAYTLDEDLKEEYKYVSMINGSFYWNGNIHDPFSLNDFYNPLDIEWEIR